MKKVIKITLLITMAVVIKRVTGKSNENNFVIPRSNDDYLKILNQISSRVTS